MKALDRLRALEKPRNAPDCEPTKPPKAPFVSFGSAGAAPFRKFEAADKPEATPAQAAELRALVARVAASWPESERAESLAVALADPEAALVSFRALVADMEPAPPVRQYPAGPYTSAPLAERDPADDRRICRDCAHLSGTGRCLSAWRGNPPVGAGKSYHPIDDLLRRCEIYVPGPDDPDRRSGAERWPGMVADAIRRREMAARG